MLNIKASEDQMKKVLDRLQHELAALRTGRAHISLVEHVKVEYYGSLVPMSQVASLSISEGRNIEIKPWDKEALKPIEQAILKSDIGITPLNDGKAIRLTLPAPTQERRQELVKHVRKMAEEFRVGVRNVRRDVIEALKKDEKEKKISQDDLKRSEQDAQKLTDLYIRKIDETITVKEKEILEV